MKRAVLQLLLVSITTTMITTTACFEPPNVIDPPDVVTSTVSIEKRSDGRAEISSQPPGLRCDADCVDSEAVYEDVASVDVVIDAFPGAQLIRAFCTSPGQETIDAAVGGGVDDIRLTVPTIVDGIGLDWRCVSEHRQVHTIAIFPRGTGSGVVVGSLPASLTDDSIKRVDCGDECDGGYFVGDVETLTATADAGSVFVRWNRCDDLLDDDSAPTITLTIADDDINCEAFFELLP